MSEASREAMRVVVVDSKIANLPNAVRGLQRAGALVTVSTDPDTVAEARRLVLPGVGAFRAAMAQLRRAGLDDAVRAAAAAGAAILGICLGHQLLFEESEEHGVARGLGLIPGRVVRLPAGARVPNMGWCRLTLLRSDPLFAGVGEGAWMYFVHSFVALPEADDLVATVPFGSTQVCAAVRRGRIAGVQFHPEKSGACGARVLANFVAGEV